MSESTHLSLVLPVLNGADRLASALPSVATWMQQQPSRTELVLVDDGSGSETAALLQRFASDTPKVTVLVNGRNRGKGHAVARGMLAGDRPLPQPHDAAVPVRLRDEEARLADLCLVRTACPAGVPRGKRRVNHKIFFDKLQRV